MIEWWFVTISYTVVMAKMSKINPVIKNVFGLCHNHNHDE